MNWIAFHTARANELWRNTLPGAARWNLRRRLRRR